MIYSTWIFEAREELAARPKAKIDMKNPSLENMKEIVLSYQLEIFKFLILVLSAYFMAIEMR